MLVVLLLVVLESSTVELNCALSVELPSFCCRALASVVAFVECVRGAVTFGRAMVEMLEARLMFCFRGEGKVLELLLDSTVDRLVFAFYSSPFFTSICCALSFLVVLASVVCVEFNCFNWVVEFFYSLSACFFDSNYMADPELELVPAPESS